MDGLRDLAVDVLGGELFGGVEPKDFEQPTSHQLELSRQKEGYVT